MKKIPLILLGLFMLKGNAATQDVNVSAAITIISPIGIMMNNDINFGSFAPGTMSSTIQVASNGSRSVTSGDADLASGGATPSPLVFTVTGASGYNVSLTYDPPVGNTVNLNGPGPAIPLSLISPTSSCTLSGGQCNISVGASITVPSGQPPGNYSGIVTIFAQYT